MGLYLRQDLDKLIAEQVFGQDTSPQRTIYGHMAHAHIKPYSQDIASAWEVVTKVGADLDLYGSETEWEASFGSGWHRGESAAQAICFAALALKGVSPPPAR